MFTKAKEIIRREKDARRVVKSVRSHEATMAALKPKTEKDKNNGN